METLLLMAARVQEEEEGTGGGTTRERKPDVFPLKSRQSAGLDSCLSSCKQLLVCLGAAVRSRKCQFKFKG